MYCQHGALHSRCRCQLWFLHRHICGMSQELRLGILTHRFLIEEYPQFFLNVIDIIRINICKKVYFDSLFLLALYSSRGSIFKYFILDAGIIHSFLSSVVKLK